MREATEMAQDDDSQQRRPAGANRRYSDEILQKEANQAGCWCNETAACQE